MSDPHTHLPYGGYYNSQNYLIPEEEDDSYDQDLKTSSSYLDESSRLEDSQFDDLNQDSKNGDFDSKSSHRLIMGNFHNDAEGGTGDLDAGESFSDGNIEESAEEEEEREDPSLLSLKSSQRSNLLKNGQRRRDLPSETDESLELNLESGAYQRNHRRNRSDPNVNGGSGLNSSRKYATGMHPSDRSHYNPSLSKITNDTEEMAEERELLQQNEIISQRIANQKMSRGGSAGVVDKENRRRSNMSANFAEMNSMDYHHQAAALYQQGQNFPG
eukprot:CAMPEP_0115040996 /NCGR_PEP_ID=MMETSP0216-20121206/45244_1 /TAXON_ID=223996 /ORGANISM="Protocruzia adherens, Strain Boccale" /LENGTH=271 /DNA_ID=CAMNT_0002422509 /DNA_START=62 /DNA_END=874 /DNA_ORIENTATION=+